MTGGKLSKDHTFYKNGKECAISPLDAHDENIGRK